MPAPHLLFLVLLSSSALAEMQQVAVDVYYESLCPDSIKFITKQLAPVRLSPLGKYMKLNLIPYGKATTIPNSDGSYNFTCHHGPRECMGNKVQACALKILTMPDDQFKFINCTMGEVNPKDQSEVYPTQKCGEMLGLKVDEIQDCASNITGEERLAEMGNITEKISLKSVPTIVFEGKPDGKDQEMAKTDFKKALCSHMKDGNSAPECAAAPSRAADIAATLMPIIGALIISRL